MAMPAVRAVGAGALQQQRVPQARGADAARGRAGHGVGPGGVLHLAGRLAPWRAIGAAAPIGAFAVRHRCRLPGLRPDRRPTPSPGADALRVQLSGRARLARAGQRRGIWRTLSRSLMTWPALVLWITVMPRARAGSRFMGRSSTNTQAWQDTPRRSAARLDGGIWLAGAGVLRDDHGVEAFRQVDAEQLADAPLELGLRDDPAFHVGE